MVRRVKADLKDVLHRVAARCSKFLRRPRRTESGRRLFCTRFKAFRMVKRTGRCPSGASSSTRRAICMAPPHMAAVDLASSRAQRRAAELCMNYRPHRRKAVSGRTRSSIIFRAETTANFPGGTLYSTTRETCMVQPSSAEARAQPAIPFTSIAGRSLS